MFTLPELPYGYEALEPVIDAETMHLHHDKHHTGYVNSVNDALSGIGAAQRDKLREAHRHVRLARVFIRIGGEAHRHFLDIGAL